MSDRDASIVDPSRAAWSSIGGYFYQASLSVLRWLDLADGEYLICEGDEDIDRRIREGVGESEQVKHRTGAFDERDLRKVLAGFVRTYVALRKEGQDRTFRLTTNVPRYRWRVGGLDLLAAWSEPERRDAAVPQIAAGLRELLARVAKLEDALSWLDAEGNDDRWAAFIKAVEWSFDAPEINKLRGEIGEALGKYPDCPHLNSERLIDRLICAVLDASVREDPCQRILDRAALAGLLASTEQELEAWAESPPAARMRAALAMERLLDPMMSDRRDSLEPSVLLRPEYQVVGFVDDGRQAELEHLAEWCADPAPLKIELWTGEGGSGKTRLMVEWCRRLRAQGWHAGFLREFTDRDLDFVLQRGAPRFVVLDYPETRVDEVKRVLRRLGTHGARTKLRVVLLARQADGWWANLPGPGEPDIKHLFTVVAPPETREIEPLAPDVDSRHRLFQHSAAVYASVVGGAPDPALPADLDDDPRFERALYVQMAALLGVLRGTAPSADDPLHEVLDHERSFWVRGLRLRHRLDEELALVDTAAALLTLAGGARSADNAKALIEWALPEEGPEMRRVVRGVLADVYADRRIGYELASLQPDLLGEQLVTEVLAGDEALALLDTVLGRFDTEQQARAVTVLARIAARHEPGRPWLETFVRHWAKRPDEIADPLGPALAQALETSGDHESAAAISSACDAEGDHLRVPLRELAAAALQVLRGVAEDAAEQAWILNTLGNRLSALGRREDALAATQEAVGLYHQLAHDRPDAFRPDLATSLGAHSQVLGTLGRPAEAMAAAGEGAALLAPLFERHPTALAGLIRALCREHQRFAEAAGLEPNYELLNRVAETLKALEGDG